MHIPFTRPDITEAELAAVCSVLRSGRLTGGETTRRFALKLARYTGADGCVCASSATAGLIAALLFCRVGPGDEVIVPAYTFTATAACVTAVGAKPVFADVPEGSFHLDADGVESCLSPRTKAVLAVDFGGVCCDYEAIRAVCPPGVAVIADAAHALGAQGCGTMADLTVFSFHAVKNLTTAEGGAVVWRLPGRCPGEVEKTLSHLLLHGLDRASPIKCCAADYDVLFPGTKGNLPDVLAAIGLSQLSRYDAMLSRRLSVCRRYDAALPPGWTALQHDETTSAHLYAALLPEGLDRGAVFAQFAREEIECSVHFRPLPLTTAWRPCASAPAAYPNAEALWRRELSLPLSSVMTDEEVDAVCAALKRYA